MATDENEPQKKSKLPKILIVLILLGGIGFVAWKFVLPMFLEDKTESVESSPAEESADNVTPDTSSNIIVPLPTFMVNLTDPLGRRYIKLTIEVEVNSADAQATLEGSTPRVRDAINMLLSSKSYADLASTENKIILKSEIVERLNQILGGPKVARVYFVDFVIQ